MIYYFALLYTAIFLVSAKTPTTKTVSMNPIIAPWAGPYGGTPPFDKIQVKDFKSSLEEAFRQYRSELNAITNNPAAPTFDNTIVALERAGESLNRFNTIYGVWSANKSTPEFQTIEQELEPKLAAFQDEIVQNPKLFPKIEAVYRSEEKGKLNPEQQRLVWHYYTHFVLQGAQLPSKKKEKVAELNQRLATLYTQFSQNLLSEEEKNYLLLEKTSDLAGLPASFVEAIAKESERRGMKGKWIIANTRSSMETFLTYSQRRALREKAFQIWSSRGDAGNAFDNNKVVTEIVKLRFERAKLLGYKTFAHWRLADSMAKEPSAAMDLMLKVWKPAVARVQQEVADMQELVKKENETFKIQPWDYRYYAEKVRKDKYDLDFNELKPYLQLKNIQSAMFWVAKELYGFHFEKIKGLPTFHKDVTAYKVIGRDKSFVGLWYFDPYARQGKRSGAWMSAYREQQKVDQKNIKTIVSNNSNFMEAKAGAPVLISWDDANTMFHEFGHALHGLNSNVTYPSLSGTNTLRDFVEFPSQISENWLETPEVLNFLKNEEGKSIPKAMIAKIQKAKTFNQGFATVEFLASAIMDMKLHLTEGISDPKAFEKETLIELGMPSEIVMRHRIPQFSHLFSAEDYAAGYYGYLWAQVLDHDAFEAFTEASGPYDKSIAEKLRKHIMSVGNTVDPAEAFRNFRGRDPKVEPLLKARGFLLSTNSL